MTAPPLELALPVFSGPLDLLLHLIERQELDITTISLAQVADQYLSQIERLKQERMESLIDFIVIGARLALIKSRALLPQPAATYDDEGVEEDPAAALLRQLRTYRRFKMAGLWLQGREESGLRTHLRVAPPPRLEKRLDLTGVTLHTLMQAIQEVLHRQVSLEESVSLVRPRTITIDDQIRRLRSRLRQQPSLYFHELLSTRASRLEIAVTLLATLELIKRREVQAVQPRLFGPIELVGTSLPAALDEPAPAPGAKGDDTPLPAGAA